MPDITHGIAPLELSALVLAALLTIGLLAGVTGGLLGVGGSIVMIPALTEVLGPNQHLYQAAAMIVNFFVVVPAVVQHRRAGAIDRVSVARLIPPAAIAVVVGVLISELDVFAGGGERHLRGLFGLFLLGVCVTDLYRLVRPPPGTPDQASARPRAGWRFAAAVAVPTGLVAGMLGVGGGVLAVPLQRRWLGVPIRRAIANSATIIVATSVIGAGLKNYALITTHGYRLQAVIIAATLAPTAIIGSLVGSRLTHRLPIRHVKIAFLVLLAVAAVRLTYRARM
ncbi:MAG: sulfite exporter TauE/SafE family protein [Phycisphaerae bacterium]